MKRNISSAYRTSEEKLNQIISNFNFTGEIAVPSDRNALKIFDLNGKSINVKSFRVPNVINQIVYRFFRKGKAQRSYEYANRLQKLGIGTPEPIAYYEFYSLFLFKTSYYICEHVEPDYTYRDLTFDFNIPDYENILRGFTRFTYSLHENNIRFLDHSPGNTLIKKVDSGYEYLLVDLNRMEFGPMDLDIRIKNFERLTIHKEMVRIMSDEYAKISGKDFDKIFNLMWRYTESFQDRFHRKKRLKNKLLFWRADK